MCGPELSRVRTRAQFSKLKEPLDFVDVTHPMLCGQNDIVAASVVAFRDVS